MQNKSIYFVKIRVIYRVINKISDVFYTAYRYKWVVPIWFLTEFIRELRIWCHALWLFFSSLHPLVYISLSLSCPPILFERKKKICFVSFQASYICFYYTTKILFFRDITTLPTIFSFLFDYLCILNIIIVMYYRSLRTTTVKLEPVD